MPLIFPWQFVHFKFPGRVSPLKRQSESDFIRESVHTCLAAFVNVTYCSERHILAVRKTTLSFTHSHPPKKPPTYIYINIRKHKHVSAITLFYYQITPIDGERSRAMVRTVCGQELMKRPNHTAPIMESSPSHYDGIGRY